ncbi:MAG: hypothetical protein COS65_29670 [Armatimonadetes bacterium CG06_land_8_20_14_3_00_66_21]|nr:MAG: hypothetical protein COS65_29670 [Armatimonadetes bacterium CG06_land_8_20_14_3_00_66_21]
MAAARRRCRRGGCSVVLAALVRPWVATAIERLLRSAVSAHSVAQERGKRRGTLALERRRLTSRQTPPTKLGGPRSSQERSGTAEVDADHVVICGGSDRGTLFAVYRFLEELGCRWLAPDQEFVPTRATLNAPARDLKTAPVFNMRTFVARDEAKRAWGVKLGINGFYTADDPQLHGNGYYLPAAVPSCHAYHELIPAEKYFDKHPEWFPLTQGERRPGRLQGAQLCVTAEGLADEFARRVIELFDADPNLNVLSISPNDGRGWCECEQCKALDERLCGSRTTKQGLAGEQPFMGDRVFWFANQVAERVAKVHPDKLLLVLAYINYAEPPDTVVPAKNVVPWLCHYAPADYSRPISDPTSAANAQFNALLTRWAQQAPHLLFYSYVSKSMWWRLPRPVVHNFAADVKYLHSLGLRRYYCQSTLTDWPEAGPLYYVLCKLLWDPSQDPNALAADWVTHMFGPAAKEMASFYAAVENSVKASGQSYSDDPPRDVPGLYDQADLDRAQRHLDDALTAAAGDEGALTRLKPVAETFRYGRHMIAALEAAHQYQQAPTIELAKTIEEQTANAWASYPYRYAKRYFDGIRMHTQLGVISSGFGEGEQKGGRLCWNSDETGPGDNAAGWATFFLNVADTKRPVRLEMDVWGTSQLDQVVINTGGQRKGYAEGGVWNPVKPKHSLSGKEQWDTLVFTIPADLLAADKPVQTIGFGGADSQVWVGGVRFGQGEQ